MQSDVSYIERRMLQQRLAQIDLLTSFAASDTSDHLIDYIGNFIYLSLLGVIHYDRIALALMEQSGDAVKLRWQRTEIPELLLTPNHTTLVKGTSLEEVLRSGKPRVINNEDSLRPPSASEWTRFFVKQGIHSNVTCPLFVKGRPAGVVVFSSRQHEAYQAHKTETFQRIGQALSRVLEAARGERTERAGVDRLTKALVQLVNTMEEAQTEAALLDSVMQKINAGRGFSDVMNHVFESFSALIPYSRIGCALLEDEGRVLRTRWVKSKEPKLLLREDYAAPLAGSSLAQVMQAGQPRILNDLPAYLAAHPNSDSTRLLVAEGMRANLTCPLVASGRPMGVLFFSNTHVDAYDYAHVSTLMRVARQLSLMVEKGRYFQELTEERARSETLLADLLPSAIAQRLKYEKKPIADAFNDVTVLFADVVNFSTWSSHLPPSSVVELLNQIYTAFDELVRRHGVEKISTKGDGYLAVAGVPAVQANHAERAAALALAMRRAARKIPAPNGGPVLLRIGLHSGPIIAGTVGTRSYHYDVWGSTVNLASRMESLSEADHIQVSQQTFEKLQGKFRFQERGVIYVKGMGEQKTWWLKGKSGG